VNRKIDVAELVGNYRDKYPTAPRDLLRKTIRLELEHRKIPFTDALERKLDRELHEVFSVDVPKVEIDNEYEKRLETIRNENLSNPHIAFFDLLFFMATLPSHIQHKLGLEFLTATQAIMQANQWRPFENQIQKEERLKTVMSIVVLSLVNRIPVLLNEERESALLHKENKPK
jgi:hypothetical protein